MRLRERYRRLTLWNKVAFWGSVASITGLAVAVLPPRADHRLTPEQKRAFVAALSATPAPREVIRLSCPGADERACILAGEFLGLFQSAGWKVLDDSVVRGQLGKPRAGIVLLKRGVTTTPPPPGSGVWVEQSTSLIALQRAFAGLGMSIQQAADASQPEGAITVFVGPL